MKQHLIYFTVSTAYFCLITYLLPSVPIPVAARSKACVCGRSFAGIVGSSLAGGMDVCLLWALCVVS